jgi:hypothetical protein
MNVKIRSDRKPMQYADLQIMLYHSAKSTFKNLMNSCRAHTVGGRVIYNDVVFVDFDMPIQVPFKNIWSTVLCNEQKNIHKEKIYKKDSKSRDFLVS